MRVGQYNTVVVVVVYFIDNVRDLYMIQMSFRIISELCISNNYCAIIMYNQGPVKQVRGPGHNVSCGAPALVLHENMRNTCLNYLQVRPR